MAIHKNDNDNNGSTYDFNNKRGNYNDNDNINDTHKHANKKIIMTIILKREYIISTTIIMTPIILTLIKNVSTTNNIF